jgi:hypothetical protein
VSATIIFTGGMFMLGVTDRRRWLVGGPLVPESSNHAKERRTCFETIDEIQATPDDHHLG